MIDKILLFPYWLILKLRHFMYDCGLKKVHRTEVPSICIGNITVGGTGKTPHTEMLIRTLLNEEEWAGKNIAVLSRGYKRSTKGFQQVPLDGKAKEYGDEPLQIKKKFPSITVAVDSSRVEGCRFLSDPEKLHSSKKARRCRHKNIPKADVIILDDAFQHRAIKADLSIVLVDYNRPIFKDHLMPIGRLRDLPERISSADVVIVSKCPPSLDAWQKSKWAEALGLSGYDQGQCVGFRKGGKKQNLFFTTITYDTPGAIYPEGDARYLYAKRLVLFSGIANDLPFKHFLSSSYSIMRHFNFPDHHKFTHSDIRTIADAADEFPTSVVMTTEKDCQRVRDYGRIPGNLKLRLFYTPIKTEFLSEEEKNRFISVLQQKLHV
ncbi:MAG: tetraacyldisaccharide 4'-kinase [Bacteroidales bacterium]|nr:tetraacyldisaccharide 4'-kinase [Bacteroidales bacterium]